MSQPFYRSERAWVSLTTDHDELRRRLIKAQNEIDRLNGFLALLASPVPFSALSDPTLKGMGQEFSKRLILAQAGARGDAVPKPTLFVEEPADATQDDSATPSRPN